LRAVQKETLILGRFRIMEGFSEFLSEEVREVSHSQKEGPVLFRHLVGWVAKVRTEVDQLVSVFVIVASETLIFKFDQRQGIPPGFVSKPLKRRRASPDLCDPAMGLSAQSQSPEYVANESSSSLLISAIHLFKQLSSS
jgi:hypothetical protein